MGAPDALVVDAAGPARGRGKPKGSLPATKPVALAVGLMHETLARHGFSEPVLQFQEAFLVRHAGAWIQRISEAEAAGLSARKLALMQLLHPSKMGQKFQVLHALR